MSENLGNAIFRDAGVPATRVTYAHVWLNDREMGVMVFKESFDVLFLKRFFDDHHGTLYEGAYKDIDSGLPGTVHKAAPGEKHPPTLVVWYVANSHDRGFQRFHGLNQDRRHTAVEVRVDEGGGDALGNSTAPARLIHDQHPPGRVGLADDVRLGERDEPAQVEDAHRDSLLGETPRHPERHVRAVGKRDDCQVAAVPVNARRGDRRMP